MKELGYDAIVLMDGGNGAFRSYIADTEVQRITECGGLVGAEHVYLRESDERKVPQCLVEGIATIVDVLIPVVTEKTYTN